MAWKDVLDRHQPVRLLTAHDELAAKLIERPGFHIGGFALVGAHHGLPDIDLALRRR
jgi:2-methylisocitrate lyase-like PEP mutase family enzyme